MNGTFLGLELRRVLRDPVSLFFVAGLPVFFYLVFGAAQEWGDQPVGRGNVTMYVMISMAAYGAVTATVSMGGRGALERTQGWGRQLGLTPLTDRSFVATKVLVATLVATVPVGLIYLAGSLTGADGPAAAWALSAAVVVVGSVLFAIYGLVCALALRSEAALGAATGSVVILAFLGNLFFPLSGTLLGIAKTTPLYGYVNLARYPLTEGEIAGTRSSPDNGSDPLWLLLANTLTWGALLAALAVWLVRRSRERQ